MRASDLQPISTLTDAYLEQLGQPAATESWSTGLPDLDHLTGGLSPGKLWAITGRPGSGKSLLALGMARHVAIDRGGRATVLTQRDTPEQQARRVLSAEATVPLHHIRDGRLSEATVSRLAVTAARLHGVALHIAQASDPVMAALVLQVTEAGPPPHLVVVDSITAGHPLVELRDLRQLAATLRCAVVAVLAHVPSRPLQAAEEAATLGADIVMRLDDWSTSTNRSGEADLVVTYHRDGPVTRIDLLNQMIYARFIPDGRSTRTAHG